MKNQIRYFTERKAMVVWYWDLNNNIKKRVAIRDRVIQTIYLELQTKIHFSIMTIIALRQQAIHEIRQKLNNNEK